jgi:enoyl-[acyl-carrier protein] reductase II
VHRLDPEASHAADQGHAQVDPDRRGPKGALDEAVREPGRDEQQRGAQKARREPEHGSDRFGRHAGGEHLQGYVQEPHYEVGQPEEHPVLAEGVGDGERSHEHGRHRDQDNQPGRNQFLCGHGVGQPHVASPHPPQHDEQSGALQHPGPREVVGEEAFKITLEAEPAVISLALGDPADLVERAHAAGAKVVHQVHTVAQARRVAELAVDAIIAQGSEAGGQGMSLGVGAMALIPQVVDAVSPIPVLAAGAVADGRGLAAALVLGAQGANVGTRFLASEEASANEWWKRTILATESEDVVRFELWKEIFPPAGEGAYETAPRVMRTSFVEEWQRRPEQARREAERLRGELMLVLRERRPHELVPFTGQTAGMIHAVLPAGEIVRGMVSEAEEALRGANQFLQ